MGRGLVLALAMLSAGCLLEHPPRLDPTPFRLDGDAIPVWLHRPAGPGPLVVLLTGDGGWRGADRALFDGLAGRGYAVAGLRAPAYLKHDLAALIEDATGALGFERRHPVVLVGFSRGAGLAIAATTRGELRREVALDGVVAVGLADQEEYAELGTLPVAVIQSTGDGYLPAAEARALFGPEGPWRRFVAIPARNHTFSDARAALERSVAEAISWIGQARLASD